MVMVQISPCLHQAIRLKKLEQPSLNPRSILKTLSMRETRAIRNAFGNIAIQEKDEKMASWG
jgi:hypothetical protein